MPLIPPEPFKPGRQTGFRRRLNKLLQYTLRLKNTMFKSGFHVIEAPDGRHVSLDRDVEPFWAKLSGSTSPYSFTEGVWSAGAFTTLSSGRTGTSNAYEVNAVASLNNMVALLRPSPVGDFRFEYVRVGAQNICVTTKGCDSANLSSSTVTLFDSGGGTVGTCTTDATGQCCISFTTPGTYSFTASHSSYNTYSSGSITLVAGTNNFTAQLTQNFTGNVLGCRPPDCSSTSPSVGLLPSITVTSSNGTDGSAVTDASGHYSITYYQSGTRTLTYTGTGYATGTQSVTVACGGTSVPDITLQANKIVVNIQVIIQDENGHQCAAPSDTTVTVGGVSATNISVGQWSACIDNPGTTTSISTAASRTCFTGAIGSVTVHATDCLVTATGLTMALPSGDNWFAAPYNCCETQPASVTVTLGTGNCMKDATLVDWSGNSVTLPNQGGGQYYITTPSNALEHILIHYGGGVICPGGGLGCPASINWPIGLCWSGGTTTFYGCTSGSPCPLSATFNFNTIFGTPGEGSMTVS